MKKPNFFLVGAPRCGTTSFYEYLREHPEVFMSPIKGPNFFGEVPNPSFPQFHNNIKKYLSLFSKCKNEKIIGEASHYFNSARAPSQIKKFNPNSKILILIRNPVDVVYSYYYSGLIPNRIPISQSLRLDHPSVKDMWKNLQYGTNIRRWIKYFGKNNVKIIIFEEFLQNPQKCFKELCNFLEINDTFTPKFVKYNPSAKKKNKLLLKIIRAIPVSFRIWIKNILPDNFLTKIKLFLSKITIKEVIEKQKDPQIEQYIKKRLKNEILLASKILKINLIKKWFQK